MIGEEFGFVGCVVLIIVFACLVYQCMNVAKKSGNLIGTYVAVGVACYMGFQSFYQHCSCYRNHAEHRTAPAIYQLWIKFLNVGVDRDRNGT